MPRTSVQYVVIEPDKPIKKESDKRVVHERLMELMEEHGGSFTKAQALEAMNELKDKDLVNSIQPSPTFGRAWWNELANKYGLILDAEEYNKEDGAEA